MKRTIQIIFIIFLLSDILVAQSRSQDSCNYFANEILNTYGRLENKYYEMSRERLLLAINEDPILKKNFLMGDSANYKKLQLRINPILKLSKEASKYTFKDNICKYFVFDTINFDCNAVFLLEDTICFGIIRGYSDCDIFFELPMNPGGEPWSYCTGDFVFEQYFYSDRNVNKCVALGPKLIRDSSFVFYVDGFSYYPFVINENRISIYPGNYDSESLKFLNKPNEFIRRKYTEADIRRFVKECPVGGKKPWWKFWD